MNKRKGENLPKGWIETTLEEIVEILDKFRVPINNTERKIRVGNIPYFGATGQVGWIDDYLFDEDLILLGEDGAPFLDPNKPKAYLVKGKSWVNNHAHVLRAYKGISNLFILHQLNQIDYKHYVSGTTRLKLPQGSMRSIPLVLAPEKEQISIVEEIEKHFSRLESGESSLRRAQTNLFRYRASVLKSAGEGHFVPSGLELEKANTNESSNALLKRILRSKTENSLFSKEVNDLPLPMATMELPHGWSVIKLEEIADVIDPNPKHRNPEYIKKGFPFLSTAQFAYPEGFDLTTAKMVSEDVVIEQETRCNFSERSIAFSRKGTIGITRFLPADYRFALLDSLCVINPSKHLSAKYINIILNTPYVHKQILQKVRGVALKQISLGEVRNLFIPIPPISEQLHIVEEVERRFSVIDDLVKLVSINLQRAARLRRSILKQAFCGELVMQDSNDEPAASLLEKIKIARQANTKTTHLPQKQKIMQPKPVNTLEEMIKRLDSLGGTADPARLLIETGLSDNIEQFFDLLREGRNQGVLDVPQGANKLVRRSNNEN